jgi:hypothetical protein
MKPTEEQQAIIECDTRLLRVNAFAGTGKTSTLVEYAKARPNDRILYIAFNKAIQTDAQGRFPQYVRSATSHGLAFREFGSKYKDKLVGNLKANQIADALGFSRAPFSFAPHTALLAGQQVMSTLVRFFASNAHEIGPQHVVMTGEIESLPYGPDDVVHMTKLAWARMINTEDASVGMLHDGYLKLYQMSNPRLPFDIILFDEAQDANPCTLDIVLGQSAAKVLVGDAHQSIYLFRGAENAMESIDPTISLDLTGSFRFGKSIAATANAMLHHLRGEKRRIRGLGGKDELAALDRKIPHAVICRSNSTVFDEAVINMTLGRKIAFVGGPQSYTFDKVADGHKLMQGEIGSIRDPFIRAFGNYDKMVDFAESTDDRELKSLIRVCGKYGRDVPLFVKAVANCAVESNKADVTLMTAHKSKGLEFSNVRLTDDFTDLLTKRGDIPSMQDIKAEELNVLYVAATRAKTRLEVNGNLASFLKRASEDPKSPITKELTRRLDAASSAPQVLTSSAAIRNLVKSRKANIKEYVFGGKFNPEF